MARAVAEPEHGAERTTRAAAQSPRQGLLNVRLASRTEAGATIVQPAAAPAGLTYRVKNGVDGSTARFITTVEATSGIIGGALQHLVDAWTASRPTVLFRS